MSTQKQLPNNPFGSLESVRDREAVFNYLLSVEEQENSNQFHLSFLDRGIASSPYADQIDQYPRRLQQGIDGKTVVSLGKRLQLANSDQTVTFDPPFKVGVIPPIDWSALNFVHSDITEACLCVGSLVDGQMRSHWTGKNALGKGQFWSATKIVPLLQVVAEVNQISNTTQIKDCFLRDPAGKVNDLNFEEVAIDIVSYRKDDAANNVFISNAHSAMMKRFSPLPQQEKWWRDLTGNKFLEFRGYYGENPTIADPQLRTSSQVLLESHPEAGRGENLVTAYDLTRLVSMMGWHHHLPQPAKIPAAQWHSLETVVRSMGYDTARYVEVAIELMGIADVIRDPVIISKLGFGASNLRNRTELTYTGLIQFVDARSQPAILRSLVLTIRGAMQKFNASGDRDLDEEARWLDARIAAEITEILRRVLMQELA